MPGSGGGAGRAQWPLQSRGPLSRCLCSSEVPLGSLCSGNGTPCLVCGEQRGMSVRAFHERHFTISHSLLKCPSCGILPCHGAKEFAPFVPTVVPLWKNLSSGSPWTNVNRSVRVAILDQTRALFSSVSCLWRCPTSDLQGRFKEPCRKQLSDKILQRAIFFFVV